MACDTPWYARLFSPCLFGHAEPIKVVDGKTLRFECPRCHADLGRPLKGQKFRARKVKPSPRRVPAKVIHGESRFQ